MSKVQYKKTEWQDVSDRSFLQDWLCLVSRARFQLAVGVITVLPRQLIWGQFPDDLPDQFEHSVVDGDERLLQLVDHLREGVFDDIKLC